MRAAFGRPMIGVEEMRAVEKVLAGPILVHGPMEQQFEEAFAQFTGAPFAVSVSSCTAGMHLIYFALGYGPGDEVIIPAQTHVATAHAVELTGAKAVFVDSDGSTGNIDLTKVEAAITRNTRAIAVVHYLGVPVDMPKVNEIASRHNLFVLEDCALAAGTRLNDIHAGLHGHAGVFSFYPVKHMTTAEGGMVITRDAELSKKLKHLRAFGVDRTHSERAIPGTYDTSALGLNYRMSEIHAAIGVEQLKKLPDFLDSRRRNFDILREGLENLPRASILPQPTNNDIKSSFYCCGLMLDSKIASKRYELMSALTSQGVGTSIYYPQPVPRMRYYADKYGYDASKFQVAAAISDHIIALPVGPHLGSDDMAFIVEKIKAAWRELNV